MRLKKAFAHFCLVMIVLVAVVSHLLPLFPHVAEELRSEAVLVKDLNYEHTTLNSLVSQVRFLEDLSWKDPPVCDGNDPFVLAVVTSAVANFERRARVRKTWANPKYSKSTGLKAVFVVGSPGKNKTLQKALDDEKEKHEDVIQADFLDTYRNLTYKTVSWLWWVTKFCPSAPFIVKTDDDVLVNPFILRHYLQEHLAQNSSSRCIHGRKRYQPYVKRRNSKWKVTKEEFPGDRYPSLILGSAYIVDGNAVDALLASVPYVPFLWLEDVFLTGLVAEKAGIELRNVERKLFLNRLSQWLYYGPSAFFVGAEDSNWEKGWNGIMRYAEMVISKLNDVKEV